MQDQTHGRVSGQPTMLYLRHQVVNLDRIAEILVKRGRVTLCFAFARIGDPGARLVLSPMEAEALLAALKHGGANLQAWVAVEDRLINLDLAVDVWIARDQVVVVPALPDQRGGPLPRSFPGPVARPILAYLEQAGMRSMEGAADSAADRPGWVEAGEHLVNLALVSGIRFSAQQVQVVFAGLPHFTRSFSYVEATALIERLQQLGSLPIDAVHLGDGLRPDGAPETAGGGAGLVGPAAGRRRRIVRWLGRRRE